ncbi:MauE/DoxX family redox-associated membrane protein [Sphingobacterium pedocola]|uniref:Methylamine utilisation protein MauE domain-containing protein n=1 Tax=Sphingobacterium pedocola TaxID=2082722 RepID=A0ABR9TBB2_9SPHI|nr:MauE/DoxX family redox-associated membrane protein [Sphingobacterium pedocola]MBE8722307.1 hypothetical protein [Sphingobacterium pedocola]
MKAQKYIKQIARYAFIILWGYAAVIKLYNWNTSREEMHMQPFANWVGEILFWLIPFIELTLIFMLINTKTAKRGLVFSVILSGIFTLYLVLAWQGVIGEVCICAGILTQYGFGNHILFNLAFIIPGITALALSYRSKQEEDLSSQASRKEGTASA